MISTITSVKVAVQYLRDKGKEITFNDMDEHVAGYIVNQQRHMEKLRHTRWAIANNMFGRPRKSSEWTSSKA